MSGRQTLILLLVLALLAALGRLVTGSVRSRHEKAFEQHKRDLKFVAETSGDLKVRLANMAVAKDEQGYATHFARQAVNARVGSVNAQSKLAPSSNYDDWVFTIEFLEQSPQFERNQIAVFIYNSELLMPRMRCTKLSLQAAPAAGATKSRRVATGVDRPDLWTVGALEFRQRTPKAREQR